MAKNHSCKCFRSCDLEAGDCHVRIYLYLNYEPKTVIMRNASISGFTTGTILGAMLIIGFYLMIQLPKDTSVNAYTYFILYACIVGITMWIALKKFNRRNTLVLNRMVMFLLITVLTTSLLFSVGAYCYAAFIDPSHLSTMLESSRQNWAEKNYSLQVIAGQGEWTWYSSPLNYALMELKVMLFSLAVIMTPIAVVFYVRNRNRIMPLAYNNPELIY